MRPPSLFYSQLAIRARPLSGLGLTNGPFIRVSPVFAIPRSPEAPICEAASSPRVQQTNDGISTGGIVGSFHARCRTLQVIIVRQRDTLELNLRCVGHPLRQE